ncbi:MAG: ABC transporter permease [Oligoflexia bacterium]|nr:ABC transporter permease [Oligoflexia bacterium]
MLALRGIHKRYRMGNEVIRALHDVSLTIEDGDFVAIMGPSGSGKSTLMHVMGLLDVPDDGSFRIDGREVSRLSEDELAVLRRKAIGFIFQQFNLLPRTSALENVSMPLIYSEGKLDLERARGLLERVGLGDRQRHQSNEMSGGQQQRVAIARALVNRPRLILADEPTGNLDSSSEREILGILKELNAAGITIVIVTHEPEIAQQARRIIRMRDGAIVSDERLQPLPRGGAGRPTEGWTGAAKPTAAWKNLVQHFQQGIRTLAANKVRTGLSILGILIGVAAVVAMMALGRGAQKAIEDQLASLGSNLLIVRAGAHRGAGGVVGEAGALATLSIDDARVIRERIPGVRETSAAVRGRGQVAYLNRNRATTVLGASAVYARMHADLPTVGRFFADEEDRRRARVAVVGATLVREVLGGRNPIGETIKINKIGFQVIGVLPEKGANAFHDQDDRVIIPVQTAMRRVFGKDNVDFIEVEVSSPDQTSEVETRTRELLLSSHKVPPSQRETAFDIRNMAEIQAALTASTRVMTLLLSIIAAISLLVGGIGIMNIMLVSVTERTREIGLRKAVGARRRDILSQFLVEAVVISLIGGVCGIALAWVISMALSFFAGWTTSISPGSVLVAFFFSAGIGVAFGLYPARQASRLPPIDALRYE